MSKSGSFNILFNDKPSNLNIIDVLDLFDSFGWSLNDHGNICYLPLGDIDFEWEFVSLSEKEMVYSILLKKVDEQEIVGINLMSEKYNVGLSVLFYPNFDKVTLSAEINRKTVEDFGFTDFTWYLKEIIPVFLNVGLSIEVIECFDV